jgi:RNA polymerase sigma-70 factor, ECF subfamily
MTAGSPLKRRSQAEPVPFDDLEAVYDAYFSFVWRCLSGLGVSESALDDATQDVFVVVHRKLSSFRGESSLRTWLYGIVRNVAANHRRSQRRRPNLQSLLVEPPSARPGPEDSLAEREALHFVEQFLAGLSEAKRELFVLALLEELSVPEIAEMLGIPLNTAYTRLRSLRQDFMRAQPKSELET